MDIEWREVGCCQSTVLGDLKLVLRRDAWPSKSWRPEVYRGLSFIRIFRSGTLANVKSAALAHAADLDVSISRGAAEDQTVAGSDAEPPRDDLGTTTHQGLDQPPL